MLAGIEEGESVLVSILLGSVAKAVVDVLHELAVTDGQYLVESS